ncbi:proteoglycan 4-like [Argopecten irradians]|uniref:proteoglycan 4-like n=1 Tax=Argopecten irradians TaxID=31199 RepID=UPI00371FE7B2
MSTLIVGHSQAKYFHKYLRPSDDIFVVSRSGYRVKEMWIEIEELVPMYDICVIHCGANNLGRDSAPMILKRFQRLCQQICIRQEAGPGFSPQQRRSSPEFQGNRSGCERSIDCDINSTFTTTTDHHATTPPTTTTPAPPTTTTPAPPTTTTPAPPTTTTPTPPTTTTPAPPTTTTPAPPTTTTPAPPTTTTPVPPTTTTPVPPTTTTPAPPTTTTPAPPTTFSYADVLNSTLELDISPIVIEPSFIPSNDPDSWPELPMKTTPVCRPLTATAPTTTTPAPRPTTTTPAPRPTTTTPAPRPTTTTPAPRPTTTTPAPRPTTTTPAPRPTTTTPVPRPISKLSRRQRKNRRRKTTTPSPRTSTPPTPTPRTSTPPTPTPRTSTPPTPAPRTSIPPTPAPRTSIPPTPAPRSSIPPTPAPKEQESLSDRELAIKNSIEEVFPNVNNEIKRGLIGVGTYQLKAMHKSAQLDPDDVEFSNKVCHPDDVLDLVKGKISERETSVPDEQADEEVSDDGAVTDTAVSDVPQTVSPVKSVPTSPLHDISDIGTPKKPKPRSRLSLTRRLSKIMEEKEDVTKENCVPVAEPGNILERMAKCSTFTKSSGV